MKNYSKLAGSMKRSLILGAIGVFTVGAFFAIDAVRQPSDAAPKVSWEPTSVDVTVAQGGSTIVLVTFTPTQRISNATVRVVPELEEFVSVEPASLSNIGRGDATTLTLTVQADAADALDTLDGVLQLREVKGKRNDNGPTIARPLPVTLTIATPDSFTPPDPGEAGNVTLEGVDADADGLRDDIEIFIEQTFQPGEEQRDALHQFSKASLVALVAPDDPDSAQENMSGIGNAIECTHLIFGEQAYRIISEIESEILNTPERSKAHFILADRLGGTITAIPNTPSKIDVCRF